MARPHLLISVTMIALTLLWGGLLPVRAQAPMQVGVVVQDGEGQVSTYCVTLIEADATGYDALLRAGPGVTASVSAQGVAVCAIGGTGCPASDCFCRCRGAACEYWAYFVLRDGAWQASNVGAGARRLSHGDVDGWRWGPGDPPPALAFEEICTAPTGQPTVMPGTQQPGDTGTDALSWAAPAAIALAAASLAVALSRRNRD